MSSSSSRIGSFTSVTHPWALEKFLIDYNGENDASISLLIGSFSNLLVTRTGIRSQTSLNLISWSNKSLWSYLPLIVKKDHRWYCSGYIPFISYRIFMKLADNLSRHKISQVLKIWPEWNIYFGGTCLDCWKDHIWPSGDVGLPFGRLVLWNAEDNFFVLYNCFETISLILSLFTSLVYRQELAELGFVTCNPALKLKCS